MVEREVSKKEQVLVQRCWWSSTFLVVRYLGLCVCVCHVEGCLLHLHDHADDDDDDDDDGDAADASPRATFVPGS